MNKLLASILILSISIPSFAHDPKLHRKKPEKANCAALESMKKGKSNMDMSDPIMLAMIKKCEKQALTNTLDNKNLHSGQAEQESNESNKNKEKKDDDNHSDQH